MKRLMILSCAVWLAGCADQGDEAAGGTGKESELAAEATTESTNKQAKLEPKDVEFMKDAARGGIAEVKMGELGLSNGESQAVKDFSRQLVDDHTKANRELEKLAIQKRIVLPDGVSEQHKTMLQHLSSLRGREFDAAFQQHAVDDHQKDIQKFKTAAAKAQDLQVRSFAEKVLPVLQRHLEAAQNLSGPTASR
jgi:putative membrane protein